MLPQDTKTARRRQLSMLLVLVAAWLLWSGLFKPLLLLLGGLSCALTFVLIRRMGFFDNELFALRLSARLLRYWIWLSREVWRSSLEVAGVVLNPRLPVSPRIVEIEAGSPHPVDQVILANSITLTPGTLALDLHQGVIKVHSLTEDGAADVVSGEINRRVSALREG